MEIRIQISFSPEMENQKRIQLNWVASNWWFGCLSLNNISSISSILSTSFTTRKNSHCYLNINWLRVYIAFNGNDTAIEIIRTRMNHSNWKSSKCDTLGSLYSIGIIMDWMNFLNCHIAFSPELHPSKKQFTFYWCCVKCVPRRKAQSTPRLIITRRYRATFIKRASRCARVERKTRISDKLTDAQSHHARFVHFAVYVFIIISYKPSRFIINSGIFFLLELLINIKKEYCLI